MKILICSKCLLVFLFGYGLSYTAFDYSDASVKVNGNKIDVTVTVSNTGKADLASFNEKQSAWVVDGGTYMC